MGSDVRARTGTVTFVVTKESLVVSGWSGVKRRSRPVSEHLFLVPFPHGVRRGPREIGVASLCQGSFVRRGGSPGEGHCLFVGSPFPVLRTLWCEFRTVTFTTLVSRLDQSNEDYVSLRRSWVRVRPRTASTPLRRVESTRLS